MQENSKKDRGYLQNIIILIILCAFFMGIFFAFGTPLYNDSDQYLNMHVHREPVYPLLLHAMKMLFPAANLSAASLIQSALCALSCFAVVIYVKKEFGLNAFFAFVCTVITVTPYIITPLFSKLHVMMSVAIMSESIALPVFYLFVISIHSAVIKTEHAYLRLAVSFLLSLLLCLIRSQMVFTFVLWLIVAVAVCILRSGSGSGDKTSDGDHDSGKTGAGRGKLFVRILICLAAFVLAFVVRDVATRTYNMVYNGKYVDSVYSHINLLANIMYVSDRDDFDGCDDEELKEMFYVIYDQAAEAGYLYDRAYADAGVGDGDGYKAVLARVEYLEEVHDRIKYDCIEYGLRDIVEESTGIHDYIEYNRIADSRAGEMIRVLLPEVFGKWAADAFLLGTRGLIRNVSVCRGILIIYAFVFIIALCIICVWRFKKYGQDKTAWFILISLLAAFGNSYCTALVIMCLSRYMIYGFAPAYISAVLCFAGLTLPKAGNKITNEVSAN